MKTSFGIMSQEAHSAANSLALRYDAFNEARENGNSKMITLWGNLLIESQEEVGVELYRSDHIRAIIAS